MPSLILRPPETERTLMPAQIVTAGDKGQFRRRRDLAHVILLSRADFHNGEAIAAEVP